MTSIEQALQEVDYQSLTAAPLCFRRAYSNEKMLEEVREVFSRFQSELFVSPTRNVYCLPILVPGGDWRATDNFKTENMASWTEPEWTELANACPTLKAMITDNMLYWNTLTPRVMIISPLNSRGVVPHRGAWTDTFDKAMKLRYHLNGDPFALHFIRKDRTPVVADQRNGLYVVNANFGHYATWDGDEETRRFSVTAGLPARYKPEFYDHLRKSLEAFASSVVRISPEEADDRNYDNRSSGAGPAFRW